jgi:hypothetical protein
VLSAKLPLFEKIAFFGLDALTQASTMAGLSDTEQAAVIVTPRFSPACAVVTICTWPA